jgi:hypothetical protein
VLPFFNAEETEQNKEALATGAERLVAPVKTSTVWIAGRRTGQSDGVFIPESCAVYSDCHRFNHAFFRGCLGVIGS